MKRQFRQLTSHLTRRAPDQETVQGGGTGEIGGSIAPKLTLHRREVVPPAAYAPVEYMPGPLDLLSPWHHDTFGHGEFFGEQHFAESNDLYFDM